MNRVYCLLVCLFCACQVSLCKELDEKVLFEELDQLLAQQQELTQEKERKIKIIKEGLSVPSITLEQEYAINNRLYDEYLAFKYDSAYKYVNRNFIIAKRLNNKKLYTESTFNLVHILSVAGLFDHAYVLIDSIDVRELSGQDLQDYYQTYSDLVLFSTEFSVGTDFYSDNLSQTNNYYRRFLLFSIVVITSVAILLVVALIFMRRYLCRYRDEKEKVELANEKLNNYLGQLEKTNVLLKQHGAIKEQYIGRFMELVSVVIVRGEEQRKLANRLAREHKLEKLFALLKSSDFVSENNKP